MTQSKLTSVILFFAIFGAFIAFSASIARASNAQNASGAHLLQVSPTPTRSDAFTFCAYQGGTCSFGGTKSVRYGANNAYIFKTVTSSIACNATAFGGDPAPGQTKECRYIAMPVTSYVSWIACAIENGVCTGYGGNPTVKLVRYGVGNSYLYHTTDYLQNNSIACTNQAFGGDPAPGLRKQCLFIELPHNSTAWTQCAVEGGTCYGDNPARTIAYGSLTYGAYYYKSVTTSVACTSAVFGDPFPSTTKACYKTPRDWDSSGWIRCSNEGGTCAFLGTKTVAYGANGTYYYKNATDGIACNSTAFGGDPTPGVSKLCYYNTTFGE